MNTNLNKKKGRSEVQSRGPVTNTKEAIHMNVPRDVTGSHEQITRPDPATAPMVEDRPKLGELLAQVPPATLAETFRLLAERHPGDPVPYEQYAAELDREADAEALAGLQVTL
jgi:hypothetical protein